MVKGEGIPTCMSWGRPTPPPKQVEREADWRPNGGRRAGKQQEARLGGRFSMYTLSAGNTVNFKTLYVNIENMKAAPVTGYYFVVIIILWFVNSPASYIGTETFVCRGRRKLSFQDRQEGGHYICTYTYFRRQIRLKECNDKCLFLKKLTSKGTLQRVFFCLRPLHSYDPILSPYTPCTCICTLLYIILIHTRKRGGGS